MSKFIQTYKRWLLPAALIVLVVAVTLGSVGRNLSPAAGPQELTLVAKESRFFLPERPGEPNPPIQFTRGRPVKLTLRNDEPGKVLHCFTIGGLNVETTRDLEAGESEVLSFTPAESGTFAYACLMHQMMTGKVVVQ